VPTLGGWAYRHFENGLVYFDTFMVGV